jgi:hypothetical protein
MSEAREIAMGSRTRRSTLEVEVQVAEGVRMCVSYEIDEGETSAEDEVRMLCDVMLQTYRHRLIMDSMAEGKVRRADNLLRYSALMRFGEVREDDGEKEAEQERDRSYR